tara:strand:- start:637 stop:1617 length:981 start_codon:yes stop_codon:yes gene_type:complete
VAKDHDVLTTALDMERFGIPLKEYMVLTQFYPLNGVNGVEESPVYGLKVDEYRSALGVKSDDELIFKEVQKCKGKAMHWFSPGDIVCRRIGLEEDLVDVLRPMQDKVFVSKKVGGAAFKEELEHLRREAIEGHKWKVRRRKTWAAVVDPKGRAVVFAFRYWTNAFKRLMEQLCPIHPKHKIYSCAPYRVAASWCALKTVHRYAMEHCDNKITAVQFRKCMRYAEWVWWRRTEIKNMMGTGRIYKMYIRRAKRFGSFWQRCFRLMDDGVRVPSSVHHVREHPTARWIAVTPQEAEWYLGCVYWSEWYGGDPVRFAKFIKCSRGRMWR